MHPSDDINICTSLRSCLTPRHMRCLVHGPHTLSLPHYFYKYYFSKYYSRRSRSSCSPATSHSPYRLAPIAPNAHRLSLP